MSSFSCCSRLTKHVMLLKALSEWYKSYSFSLWSISVQTGFFGTVFSKVCSLGCFITAPKKLKRTLFCRSVILFFVVSENRLVGKFWEWKINSFIRIFILVLLRFSLQITWTAPDTCISKASKIIECMFKHCGLLWQILFSFLLTFVFYPLVTSRPIFSLPVGHFVEYHVCYLLEYSFKLLFTFELALIFKQTFPFYPSLASFILFSAASPNIPACRYRSLVQQNTPNYFGWACKYLPLLGLSQIFVRLLVKVRPHS